MKEYMNGDEVYRYLHISKRKMKYLPENGYIPLIDGDEDGAGIAFQANGDVQYQRSAKGKAAAARTVRGKLPGIRNGSVKPRLPSTIAISAGKLTRIHTLPFTATTFTNAERILQNGIDVFIKQEKIWLI